MTNLDSFAAMRLMGRHALTCMHSLVAQAAAARQRENLLASYPFANSIAWSVLQILNITALLYNLLHAYSMQSSKWSCKSTEGKAQPDSHNLTGNLIAQLLSTQATALQCQTPQQAMLPHYTQDADKKAEGVG